MGGVFWKTKKASFAVGKKKFSLEVKVVPFWYEGFGLMFKKENNAKPLLFSFSFPTKMTIFSWAIPFDFLAIWIDKENRVVETKVVKPGEVAKPMERFKKLIELPMTKNYQRAFKFLNKNCKKGTLVKLN